MPDRSEEGTRLRRLTAAAVLLAASMVLSRLLGLIRDRVLAYQIGGVAAHPGIFILQSFGQYWYGFAGDQPHITQHIGGSSTHRPVVVVEFPHQGRYGCRSYGTEGMGRGQIGRISTLGIGWGGGQIGRCLLRSLDVYRIVRLFLAEGNDPGAAP